MPVTPVRSEFRFRPHARAAACAALALTLAAVAAPSHAGGRNTPASSLTPAEAQAKAARDPSGSGLFVTDGVKLPYLRRGQGDFVLFLPDSGEALDSWQPQVVSIGERFEAVAYLRRSDVAPAAPVTTAAAPAGGTSVAASIARHPVTPALPVSADEGALRDLLLLASSISPGPVNVVGEGTGARLALRLALEYPDRVRSLVLSAPDPRWFPRDAAVEAARSGAATPAAMDTMLACRKLWRVAVPALVVIGERDPRWLGDPSPLRCIRSVRYQQLRGAGTRPHAHASEEFNRVVARFLERQRMTAGEP
jgi:pimeloyl-ACP methyl ester carboxylesterase